MNVVSTTKIVLLQQHIQGSTYMKPVCDHRLHIQVQPVIFCTLADGQIERPCKCMADSGSWD